MPEQYTINGTIALANGVERAGLSVRAFDRDMPSIERRTGTGQPLGKATTDADGHFQIIYTLEQFQRAEGISSFRRVREQSADLSFQVFDRAGRELNVASIEAGDRSYRPDQIIFKAPTSLDVSIFVDVLQESGTSEYERLVAPMAPVIEDVTVTELSEEDLFFLINELDLEQERDVQQHIQWLRRSALLASGTVLPVEAFYGWGRRDVPAQFMELAVLPLDDLRSVLEKLSGLSDEELRGALLAAIADDIIPAVVRNRADEIVRKLKRRDQVLHTVRARLQDEETDAPLADYTVTTFDEDFARENRGLDITDREGKFSFDCYLPRDLPPEAQSRKFSFQVAAPDGEPVLEGEPLSIRPDRLLGEVVSVKVRTRKPQAPPLEEELQVELEARPEILEFLRGKEIHRFSDIRRKGGLSHFADVPQIDPVMIHKLEALADLDRISSVPEVRKTLFDKGYDSVLAIADAPYSEFIALVSDEATGLTGIEVAKLHLMATVQTTLLNNILAGMAADAANGFELPAPTENR